MADSKIVDYINSALSQGYPADQIKQKLIESGVGESDVDEAMAVAQASQVEVKKAPEKGFNKWIIIIPLIILIVLWIVFGIILVRG
jgi:SOS response regulatory protein OraA/RecX